MSEPTESEIRAWEASLRAEIYRSASLANICFFKACKSYFKRKYKQTAQYLAFALKADIQTTDEHWGSKYLWTTGYEWRHLFGQSPDHLCKMRMNSKQRKFLYSRVIMAKPNLSCHGRLNNNYIYFVNSAPADHKLPLVGVYNSLMLDMIFAFSGLSLRSSFGNSSNHNRDFLVSFGRDFRSLSDCDYKIFNYFKFYLKEQSLLKTLSPKLQLSKRENQPTFRATL